MASSWFAQGVQEIFQGTTDLTSSTLKALLINSTGNANLQFDTHADVADVTNGMRAVNTISKFVKVSTGFAIINASDHVNFGSGSQVLTFTNVTTAQKAKGIVVFESDATEATSTLICYCSFTSSVNTDGTDVQVTLNASGFARASY
jgi:hypothetical protein